MEKYIPICQIFKNNFHLLYSNDNEILIKLQISTDRKMLSFISGTNLHRIHIAYAPYDAQLFDENFPLKSVIVNRRECVSICVHVCARSVFGLSTCGLFGFGRVQKHSIHMPNVKWGWSDSLNIREKKQQQQKTV